MSRRNGGSAAVGERDAFVVVRDVLEKLEGRRPTVTEVAGIRSELEQIHATYVRLRQISPAYRGIELSEGVWSLLELIGKKRQRQTRLKRLVSRAAGLL